MLCLTLPLFNNLGSVLCVLTAQWVVRTGHTNRVRGEIIHPPPESFRSSDTATKLRYHPVYGTHSQLVSLRLLLSVCRLDGPPHPRFTVASIPLLALLMLHVIPNTLIAHPRFPFRLGKSLRILLLHLLPPPLTVATFIFLLLLLPSPPLLLCLALLLLPCCCRFLQSLQMYLQGKKGGGIG